MHEKVGEDEDDRPQKRVKEDSDKHGRASPETERLASVKCYVCHEEDHNQSLCLQKWSVPKPEFGSWCGTPCRSTLAQAMVQSRQRKSKRNRRCTKRARTRWPNFRPHRMARETKKDKSFAMEGGYHPTFHETCVVCVSCCARFLFNVP